MITEDEALVETNVTEPGRGGKVWRKELNAHANIIVRNALDSAHDRPAGGFDGLISAFKERLAIHHVLGGGSGEGVEHRGLRAGFGTEHRASTLATAEREASNGRARTRGLAIHSGDAGEEVSAARKGLAQRGGAIPGATENGEDQCKTVRIRREGDHAALSELLHRPAGGKVQREAVGVLVRRGGDGLQSRAGREAASR